VADDRAPEDDSRKSGAVFRFLSLVTLTLELRQDFCTMHPTAKLHLPMFNRSQVIVLTNKQTDAAENIHLAPLCYAGGQQYCS